MIFCLIIAIFFTLSWIDINIADFINARLNPYAENNEGDMKRAKIKMGVRIMMALFWGVIIYFW